MHALAEFRSQAAAAAAQALGAPLPEIEALLEQPKAGQADAALPLFRLAAERKRPPAHLAKELAPAIKPQGLVASVEASGPYVNFHADWRAIAAKLLPALVRAVELPQAAAGERVIVEFSDPNIAKPMHVGHLRSTIIGDTLARLMTALGAKVTRWNYIGDWGTQFGKLVVAFEKWGSEGALAEDPIRHLLDLYVRFHAAESADLQEAARKAFKALEDGDPAATKLWKRFVDATLEEDQRVYDLLSVRFDLVEGESALAELSKAVIKDALSAGIAQHSKGGVIIPVDPLPPLLIQKSDEATLYATRDLAGLRRRLDHFKADRIVYVVGSEQKLHFQQVFAAAQRLGFFRPEQAMHVEYGLMSLPEGKMSTRKGTVVYLEDVLNEAIARARRIVEEKNPDLPDEEKAAVARAVGIGAVKYNDLCVDRIKNVTFTWDRALSFEGDTAPYLQYSHARACSILRKAGAVHASAPAVAEPAELGLVKALAHFPDAVLAAADQAKPHILANALFRLSTAFSEFYGAVRVLDAPEPQRAARLALVAAYKSTLAKGLELMGIEAPERM